MRSITSNLNGIDFKQHLATESKKKIYWLQTNRNELIAWAALTAWIPLKFKENLAIAILADNWMCVYSSIRFIAPIYIRIIRSSSRFYLIKTPVFTER